MKNISKNTIIYTLIIIIIIIGIYYFFIREEDYVETTSNYNILTNNEENVETKNKIIIHITGEVKNEGIYELEENSRIADSVEIAGGLTEEADISNINLAYMLEDGMKIHIPKKGDNSNQIKDETNIYVSIDNNTENQKNTNEKNNKININTATQTELETLPGIGPSTALKIINYRKENGKFNSIEDIKNISGIGENKYNQVKELIEI